MASDRFEVSYLFMIVAFFLLWFGGSFNMGAVMSNEGRMPVLSETEINTDTHFSFQDMRDVNNFYYTDVIKVRNRYISIGDVLIYGGFLILILSAVFYLITKVMDFF